MFEAEQVEEVVDEKPVDEMEEAARIAKEMRKEKTVEVKEFTSKFEKLADASTKQETVVAPKKEVEEVKEEAVVEVKEKPNFDSMKPIYSDEELAEIEQDEYDDKEAWDEDVDYEEYDEYYDQVITCVKFQ